ncbi:FdhF/YdeP family oxidoreductase [Escherichia coli]|nr:FdhF/YdeP family oxidoreductase [Escherichia coli]
MKKKIESYQGAAGGWGAVKSVANAVRKQMDIRQDVIAMFDMNKPEGFDCPGCAWPDPKHSASFDICENGAKAIAWEVTDKQVNASFFAENTVQSLLTWGDHELEAAGRLTQPLKYDDVSDCYKPLSWQQAFDEIGARLQSYSDPNQVEFYTSGRTSNEAAFLYQLFAREYGSNNFPDCSNMCHEPTSVGLAASIGVGKGTVLLEDFEKCDLVICIGHNPGTNHPRMLTSLRALVKRGAKMIAINPLQERGLERFTAPQNPFEMLTNSETQLASAYYNVRIGGDMALLKGMMRLLIERDDAASAAGRPSLLDDEFIQTHTVGFDELRRDVLNSEWKDIERISGLSQTQIAELADAYAAAERTIICYGMGITQHEHGTQNVQQLVNLLLMKGNIGKPGAGICPLRGHSNVQGDRTVGITEKPSAEFLDRLCERYGFTPPHAPGHAAIASMQAICTGQARALICMGGNFALAMPDREASAVPLTQLDLAVHVATKLNRSHLLTARHSYILPVLGRSEIDMQKSGAQAVTVEDSMSMIHASRGVLKPAGVMLKSECAVVAGIAQASSSSLKRWSAENSVTMSSKVSGMNTLLSVSARTNNPEPGFQLINQRITHSTINDNIWASLQNAQIQALKTLDQRPAEKFAQQMYETRYADDRTKLPQENQIAQFTAADALAADRQLFSSPADITFVIVGNVAEDKLVALITRYLGSIKHSNSPLAAGKPLTRATDNASVTVKEQNEPVAQVSQWKRYNSRTPVNLATRMALDAFNVALAKDLRINIREQASGAYSVSSRLSVDPQAKDISHLLAFTCQPERHDELLTLANEVMVKRLAKGISEQELNEYQQNVQRSLDIQQRSVQQLANTIVNSLIQYDDPAAWTEQEQLLKQMTVENVNTAVKQYLSHPVNTYTGVLLPK